MSIEITVPVLPESVADALLLDWKKQAGDAVARDEVLAEVETDKVVLEVPATADGVLTEIVVEAGATVTAGTVLARLTPGDAESAATVEVAAPSPLAEPSAAASPTPAPSAAASAPLAAASATDTDAGDDAQLMSPAVRRLVTEHGLNPADISGTGPRGRVTKEDILNFIGERVSPDEPSAASAAASAPSPAASSPLATVPSPSPAASSPSSPASSPSSPSPSSPPTDRRETREPMSRLRQTIAARLVQAQQTAALLTTFNEVNMQPVTELRAENKDEFEKRHGVRLGLMSFFVKASVAALQKYPLVNARLDGADIVRHDYNDIGIAVASERGLVVPILRGCENLTFAEIEKQIREYGARAQDGKLEIKDLTGGTFTITNGGVFGSLLSTPIVNPPQSAILGMHKIAPRPVAEDGSVVIRPMMYLALTYDHRIVDGQQAVGFLVTIKEMLEDPARMLLVL